MMFEPADRLTLEEIIKHPFISERNNLEKQELICQPMLEETKCRYLKEYKQRNTKLKALFRNF